MTLIYLGIIVIVVIGVFIAVKKRNGKDPNTNASLSVEQKEELNEDYLSHGRNNNEQEDPKNI